MRVHGTSGGSGRRRERRFGGSSSLFRPTTGTPTGCELLVACDDAALIHGVKVEPMLKLEFELLVQSNPRRIHAHLSQIRGFSRRILQTPPQNATSQASRIRLLSSLARLPRLLVLHDVARDVRRGFPRHSRRWMVGGYRRDLLHVCSITTLRTIFAPASRSSSRRRGARGAFVGARRERGERICRG